MEGKSRLSNVKYRNTDQGYDYSYGISSKMITLLVFPLHAHIDKMILRMEKLIKSLKRIKEEFR